MTIHVCTSACHHYSPLARPNNYIWLPIYREMQKPNVLEWTKKKTRTTNEERAAKKKFQTKWAYLRHCGTSACIIPYMFNVHVMRRQDMYNWPNWLHIDGVPECCPIFTRNPHGKWPGTIKNKSQPKYDTLYLDKYDLNILQPHTFIGHSPIGVLWCLDSWSLALTILKNFGLRDYKIVPKNKGEPSNFHLIFDFLFFFSHI